MSQPYEHRSGTRSEQLRSLKTVITEASELVGYTIFLKCKSRCFVLRPTVCTAKCITNRPAVHLSHEFVDRSQHSFLPDRITTRTLHIICPSNSDTIQYSSTRLLRYIIVGSCFTGASACACELLGPGLPFSSSSSRFRQLAIPSLSGSSPLTVSRVGVFSKSNSLLSL